MVAADDMSDEVSHWEQAQSCLRQLGERMRKRQVDELRSRVKTPSAKAAWRRRSVDWRIGSCAGLERRKRAEYNSRGELHGSLHC